MLKLVVVVIATLACSRAPSEREREPIAAASVPIVDAALAPTVDAAPATQALRDLLTSATDIVAYSIESRPVDPAAAGADHFHRYPILATVPLGRDDRVALAAALASDLDPPDGVGAACFSPHHALRVTRGDETVDLLICYECGRLQTWPWGTSHKLWSFERPETPSAHLLDRLVGSRRTP